VLCYSLDRNNIWSIDDDAFRGVGPELEMVDMSHNRLVRIKLVAVFRYLPRLRVLRMRYNSLVDIGSPTATLPAVVELDLTGNEFRHVPSRALASLPALRRLLLRDNRIQHVGASAFASAAFLEHVDLGANRFTRRGEGGGGQLTIDRYSFCGLEPRALSRSPGVTDWTGLQQVRLDHNGLTQPQLCSLMAVWTLVDVDVAGNPLRCDCRLLTTLRRLSDIAIGLRIDDSAQCASPDRVAGQTLAETLTRHWQPTCDDDDDDGGVSECSEAPCDAVPLQSLASSSSLTGGDFTHRVCAVALTLAIVRILAWVQTTPRRRLISVCRTTHPTTDGR